MRQANMPKHGVVRGEEENQPGMRMEDECQSISECVRRERISWRKGWRDKGGVEFHPERDGCRDTGRKEVEEY